MGLQDRKCVPCEGGVPKLGRAQVSKFLGQIQDWREAGGKIHKGFKFKDFAEAMKFINRMAEIAEGEGHHPDFFVHYNEVDVTIWTHAVGGLTENDFILAAKIDGASGTRA